MGPTNVALVKLYQAEMKLREAQGRLEAATKNVRIQERRVNDLNEKVKAAQQRLKEQQSRSATLDVEMKSRDAHIERLRTQQQGAKNNKEYQAFLVEINTQKLDRAKIEEEAMRGLENLEKTQAELRDLNTHLDGERAKLETMKGQITDQVASLQAEIESLRPAREQAATEVPPSALVAFNRLADHHDGEAMSPLIKPDRRREEYACSTCMMDLVTDVYNRLHSRDEIVFCPSCRRILYIPDDLPPELAVNAKVEKPEREKKEKKEKKERKPKAPKDTGAVIGRQSSAADVLRSVTPETDEETPANTESQQ